MAVVGNDHELTEYHVHVDGDEAKAVTYRTSHQPTRDYPDTLIVIVGPLPMRATAGGEISKIASR
jgi:hypothetical protein